jgi:hypothetical protein
MLFELIYINNCSLSKELCSTIIEKYKKELDNKHNFDYNFTINNNLIDWIKIYETLKKELTNNLNAYISNINNIVNTSECNFNIISNTMNIKDNFTIKKYSKNSENNIYNNTQIDYKNKNYRIIEFVWYLNNVEGGETEILGNLIKPEVGKLLLYPVCWCFPHMEKMPINNDKYIITGWLYIHE